MSRRAGFKRIALVLLVLALGVLVFEGYSAAKNFQAKSWPTTSGSITTSHSESRTAKAKVEYQYFVAGETFYGGRIQFGRLGTSVPPSLSLARKGDLRNYSPGASVRVHYNPEDPSDAVLETGLPMSARLLTLIAAAVGVYSVFVVFSRRKLDSIYGY